jgi:site-specific recombinase XerD
MNTDSIIADYLNYLDHMCGFAQRTINKHKRVCTTWEEFLSQSEHNHILDATPTHLLNFIHYRQRVGKIKNTCIFGELCVLRTFYSYLFDFQKISSNPAAALPKLVCEPPDEKEYLNVSECFKLLRAFDKSDPIGLRNYTIVALLWSTGLRNSELCALNWADINLKKGTLLVRKGKGGKQRQLFLNDRVLHDLLRYRQKIEENETEAVFYAFSQNASRKKRYARLSQSRLVEIIREQGKAVEINKRINPLTFRHTFATHMYDAGVKIDDIKEMLGHDDETETTIYIHISMERVRGFLKDHIAHPQKY